MQNLLLISLSFAVNLLRGTPKFESIIGLSVCGWQSFCILAVFIVVSIVMTVLNTMQIWKE